MHHIMKESNHSALIRCPCVLQAERHHLVAESPPRCNEGSFLHVIGRHLNLVVPRETIHEGEYLSLSGIIDQNVDVREREVIFRASSIQIPIINAHPYLAVFLRHWYDVCNPWGIRNDL